MKQNVAKNLAKLVTFMAQKGYQLTTLIPKGHIYTNLEGKANTYDLAKFSNGRAYAIGEARFWRVA